MKRTLIILLAIGGVLAFMGVGRYNKMVELEQNVDAQWGNVQNAYQRRADLIPNLVNTVKGYKDFEQETLSRVAEARAQVGQIKLTAEDLQDPQLMERFSEAQNQLSQTLSRLLSVSENYPDLKANESFNALIVELEGSENRIATERRKFNEMAKGYNTYIKRFPSNLFAGIGGFESVEYFESAPGAQQAPTVEF